MQLDIPYIDPIRMSIQDVYTRICLDQRALALGKY